MCKCLPARLRRGTLIFAWFSTIISGLLSVLLTGFTIHNIVSLMDTRYDMTAKSIQVVTINLTWAVISTAYFIECLSGFICSVLLLVGIKQDKPSLVMTYFIYGMIQVVLLLTFFIMLHCDEIGLPLVDLLVAVAVLGVYSVVLYMVFRTYKQIISGNTLCN